MGKVILTAGETEYTAGSFNYSLNKRGCAPTIYDESGGILKRMDCGGVEITSYSASISHPGACSGKFAAIGNVVDDLCIWVWTTPV
jgi:hypothetical protein